MRIHVASTQVFAYGEALTWATCGCLHRWRPLGRPCAPVVEKPLLVRAAPVRVPPCAEGQNRSQAVATAFGRFGLAPNLCFSHVFTNWWPSSCPCFFPTLPCWVFVFSLSIPPPPPPPSSSTIHTSSKHNTINIHHLHNTIITQHHQHNII